MNVYGVYDDDYDTAWLVQVFSTPEKALEYVNKEPNNGRFLIREIPVDAESFEEKSLDIRGSKFKVVTAKFDEHGRVDGSRSEIMNNMTREEVLKMYLNAGIVLESNRPREVNGKKTREVFKSDYFWGVPTEYEYGTMEVVHPKQVIDEMPRLSKLMGAE